MISKRLKFLSACIAVTALSSLSSAQYASNSVRLLSQIPLTGFPGSPSSGAGCAGYISPSGKEYAIIGLRNGNAVVNITNPTAPVIVGLINGPDSLWHEVAVLGQYAYATTEAGGGVQIINLTQVDSGIVSLAGTLTVSGLSRGHTVQAMPSSGLIFVHGGDVNGLRAYDCANPTAPAAVGSWNGKYVHDAQFVKYTSGPYAGKEICFACCANGSNGGLYIIDVTTTTNAQGLKVPKMETLGFLHYFPNGVDNFYCHSGSLTPDKKYFLINDEFDESNSLVPNCSTHIVNVENLATPTYAGKFVNPINAIDHNSMIQDNYLFLSAYRAGLRIYDPTDPLTMKETGYFDTFPSGNGYAYEGAWGTWAGFPSGNVLISDINRGLFVVDPSEAKQLGAPITNVAFVGYTYDGNAIKQMRLPDGDAVTVPRNEGEGLIFTVDFQTTATNRNKLDLSTKFKSPNQLSGRVTLLVKNVSTGQFDQLGASMITENYQELSFPGLTGASYITTDGKITAKIIVNSKASLTRAAINFDLVKAFVHN